MLIDRLILDNIARDRNIIQVFTARDRVLLLELTQPIFTYIKQTYQAQQFYFHPPSASSFLRVQNPEKFGDELSSFALQIVGKKLAGTVAETNAAAKDAIQIIANLTAARAGAEKNFIEVYESVNQISQQEEQIVNAMTERENTSREVLSAIRNINAVTGGVRDASAEILCGGEQVAQEMQRPNDITVNISQHIYRMVTASERIGDAVQAVNGITQENTVSIENLTAEVRKCKI